MTRTQTLDDPGVTTAVAPTAVAPAAPAVDPEDETRDERYRNRPAEEQTHDRTLGSSAPEPGVPAAAGSAHPSPTEHREVPAGGTDGHAVFTDEERRRLRTRWEVVQASFVDDPRQAAGEADALVRDTLRALEDVFQRERRQFESLWSDRESEIRTEDLRLALQRYRAFFQRLLEV